MKDVAFGLQVLTIIVILLLISDELKAIVHLLDESNSLQRASIHLLEEQKP